MLACVDVIDLSVHDAFSIDLDPIRIASIVLESWYERHCKSRTNTLYEARHRTRPYNVYTSDTLLRTKPPAAQISRHDEPSEAQSRKGNVSSQD
jgi:hypothetical protein